jgi:hypothetical protein
MSQCLWTAQGEYMCFEGFQYSEDFASRRNFVKSKQDNKFVNCTDSSTCKKINKSADCIRNLALSQKSNFRYCAVGGKMINAEGKIV